MESDFIAVDHGTGPIDLREHKSILELYPAELHHKSDGALDNTPSFGILFREPSLGIMALGQISLETLTGALDSLGYSLTKK